MERKVDSRLQELRDKGIDVYSFSRLGTFNNCQHEYYLNYIKRNKGLQNCYGLLGGFIHDCLEGIYRNNKSIDDFKKEYYEKLVELDILDVRFPSPNIEKSWKADIEHFVTNFNKIDKKMVLEKFILFEVADKIWLQGYIDAILPSEKGKPYVDIYDWKSSSKFSGKKLNEAGRQLLLYKLAIEDNTDFKADKLAWFMMKYIYVCSKYKNGKTKQTMCNRGKWVKEMQKQISKELYATGMDEFEAEMLIDKAIEDNNIYGLSQEVQDKFWLEDCIVEYNATPENIEELKQYIVSTVREIEGKDNEDESVWKGVEINQQNSFYCSVLCGQRKACKYYKQFLEENAVQFEKKEKKDEFDIFS